MVTDLVVYRMLLYVLRLGCVGTTMQSFWSGAWIQDVSVHPSARCLWDSDLPILEQESMLKSSMNCNTPVLVCWFACPCYVAGDTFRTGPCLSCLLWTKHFVYALNPRVKQLMYRLFLLRSGRQLFVFFSLCGCSLNRVRDIIYFSRFVERKINKRGVLKTTALCRKGDMTKLLLGSMRAAASWGAGPHPWRGRCMGGRRGGGGDGLWGAASLWSHSRCKPQRDLSCAEQPPKCHRASNPQLYPRTLQWFFSRVF